MSYRKFQTYFFLFILSASGLLTLLVFWPYLSLLAFGGVLAIVARPVFLRLQRAFRSDTAAAFLSIVLIATVIIIPTAFFLAALSAELAQAFSNFRGVFGGDALTGVLQDRLPSMRDQIPAIVDELSVSVRSVADAMSQNLVGVFSNVVSVLFGFVVVMISTFYFLKDGSRIKRELLLLSPLSDEHDELVLSKVVTAVGAVMNGMLIVGLVKGVMSAIFFWIFSVPAPLFWGAMCGFASFIPLFGSGLVTAPAVAYLFLTGHTAAAIGLTIVSIALIGTIDNVLQPLLVQRRTQIHPLLILLSIIGGLKFYGFAGFILGPLTLATLMALIDIYKKQFRAYVERPERGGV